MNHPSYTTAGMLSALAALLNRLGHPAAEADIPSAMEAPYLLAYEDGAYLAGASLYQPKWLNLYLQPLGFRLTEEPLPAAELPGRLRELDAAILPLCLPKGKYRVQAYTGYVGGRYHFLCTDPSGTQEEVPLSLPMLRRRLPETVRLCVLTRCQPAPVDFVPLLLATLDTIRRYQADLLAARTRTVTREQLRQLRDPLFRALMHDLQPMALLTGDLELAGELMLLEHDFRHIFTENDPETMCIADRLPKQPIIRSLTWLYEDVVDRLYALGADDEMMASRLSLRR